MWGLAIPDTELASVARSCDDANETKEMKEFFCLPELYNKDTAAVQLMLPLYNNSQRSPLTLFISDTEPFYVFICGLF
jgi:hypothetical protein